MRYEESIVERLPRELKSDFGKYIVIFLFMTLTIGFVSGFLVLMTVCWLLMTKVSKNITLSMATLPFLRKPAKSDLKKIEKKWKSTNLRKFLSG